MSNQATATEESRVTKRICCDGIPLKGIDNVKGALQAFATGRVPSANATQNQLTKDIAAEHGGMGVGLLLLSGALFNPKQEDAFLSRLFNKIESDLKTRGMSSNSFDYDAMGTKFFKSSVNVKTYDKENDIYLLKLNAAYVGGKVEDDLAEALQIDQALSFIDVTIKFPTTTGKFRFDFAEILATLKGVVFMDEDVTAESILDDMFTTDSYNDLKKSATLFQNDNISISLCISDVEGPVKYGNGEAKLLWKRDGTVVTGPVHPGYSDPPKALIPSITVSISTVKEEGFSRIPTINPTIKAEMRNFADKIESAFSA